MSAFLTAPSEARSMVSRSPKSLAERRPDDCRLILMLMFAAGPASADEHLREGEFHGQPTLVLSNDVLELSILPFGGALPKLVLQDDEEQNNPLWDSIRASEERGRPARPGGSVGHFTCVDGFGPVSEEERAAGGTRPFLRWDQGSLARSL